MQFLVDSSEDLANELNGYLGDKIINDETVSQISSTISNKIATVVSCIIAFLILFAVSMILLTVLAFLLDKLCLLPVIKQANKLLGTLFGVLCGAFHVFAASTIITLVLYLIGTSNQDLSLEIIKEKTLIYSFVQSIDLSHLIIEFLRDLI